MHTKVYENADNAMVTCSYKWPTNNVCDSIVQWNCDVAQKIRLALLSRLVCVCVCV